MVGKKRCHQLPRVKKAVYHYLAEDRKDLAEDRKEKMFPEEVQSRWWDKHEALSLVTSADSFEDWRYNVYVFSMSSDEDCIIVKSIEHVV